MAEMELLAQCVEFDSIRLAWFECCHLGGAAQVFDLDCRIHLELALFADGEHARQGHGAGPSCSCEFTLSGRFSGIQPHRMRRPSGARKLLGA